MSNLSSFLKLIRFKNLLIIVLIQVVIKFFLINAYLINSAINLSNIDFSIYLFALIAIVAGGYIINDREAFNTIAKDASKWASLAKIAASNNDLEAVQQNHQNICSHLQSFVNV